MPLSSFDSCLASLWCRRTTRALSLALLGTSMTLTSSAMRWRAWVLPARITRLLRASPTALASLGPLPVWLMLSFRVRATSLAQACLRATVLNERLPAWSSSLTTWRMRSTLLALSETTRALELAEGAT